jgi:hypothetical protein
MRRYAISAILFAFLPAVCGSWANGEDEKRVCLHFQVFKVRGSISARGGLSDDIVAGIEHPDNLVLGSRRTFRFFTTEEAQMETVKLSANRDKWTWDGKDMPPPNGPVEVIAVPTLVCRMGTTCGFEMESGPIEYFKQREDGLFELCEVKKPTTGLTIAVKPEEGPGNRIILRDFHVNLKWIAKRKPIKGVRMDVGEPITAQEDLRTAVSLLPDKYYGLAVHTDHQDHAMYFRIRVGRVNKKVDK